MYGPEEIEEAIQFLPNLRIVRFKGVRSIWQGKGRESFHQLIESLLTIESLEQIVVENAHLLSKTIRLLRTSGKLSEYHLINNDRGYEMVKLIFLNFSRKNRVLKMKVNWKLTLTLHFLS